MYRRQILSEEGLAFVAIHTAYSQCIFVKRYNNPNVAQNLRCYQVLPCVSKKNYLIVHWDIFSEWPPLPQEICQTDFARPCCSRVSPDLTRQTSGLPGALKRDVVSDVLERITCYYIVFLRFNTKNLRLSSDIQIFRSYIWSSGLQNPFCFLYKRYQEFVGMWEGTILSNHCGRIKYFLMRVNCFEAVVTELDIGLLITYSIPKTKWNVYTI